MRPIRPFDDAWREHRAGAVRLTRRRRPARTYRVDYQAGPESGHITIRSDERLTAGLVTQARASLEAEGIDASIRRIVAV
jgi:hypothetical protein